MFFVSFCFEIAFLYASLEFYWELNCAIIFKFAIDILIQLLVKQENIFGLFSLNIKLLLFRQGIVGLRPTWFWRQNKEKLF